MAKRLFSERTKRIAAAVLGVGFVAALIYQIFLSGPAPRPPRNRSQTGVTPGGVPPAASSSPAVSTPRAMSASARQEAMIQQLLSDLTPLNISLASKPEERAAPGPRGNIFGYFVDPPPPTPPPRPPPPIQLVGIQPQTAVAGTPRPFRLVVTGNKIPADAQLLFDGALRPSKRLSETQLSTEISPGDYSYPRNINIDVKSQSDPANSFSNSLTLVIQAGPEPQFIYKGRLGALNEPQYNYGVFELTSTREIKRGKVGDTIMGVWRIDAVMADAVDVTHTQYDIKRRVPLQDKVR